PTSAKLHAIPHTTHIPHLRRQQERVVEHDAKEYHGYIKRIQPARQTVSKCVRTHSTELLLMMIFPRFSHISVPRQRKFWLFSPAKTEWCCPYIERACHEPCPQYIYPV
uniref:Uncharacterized protein n=1 Tax=Anopheles atroparvus TaxID=41427 RepID=A0AAG5DPX3_ANOAO